MSCFSAKSDGDSEGKSGDGRNLLGVMRTGLFASGLMLAGESTVELVLLTAEKPTTATLHSVASSLSDELPVSTSTPSSSTCSHLPSHTVDFI